MKMNAADLTDRDLYLLASGCARCVNDPTIYLPLRRWARGMVDVLSQEMDRRRPSSEP